MRVSLLKKFMSILKFFFIKFIILKNYIEYFFDYFKKFEFKKYNNKIILISQLQKSGGHMLLSLLDGHPNLHVYPHELILNKPSFRWFNEKYFIFKNQSTYSLKLVLQKKSTPLLINDRSNVTKNFNFSLIKQEKIFKENKSNKIDVNLRLYFYSFFKSWRNYYKPFNSDPVVFFIPQFFAPAETSEKLYENFKDCNLIYICRDPLTWCRSARNYRPDKFKSIKKLLEHYINHKKLLIDNHFNQNLIIVNFDNLINNTKDEMKRLLKKLNLPYHVNNENFTSNMQQLRTLSSFNQKIYNSPTNLNNKKLDLSEIELKENKELLEKAKKYYLKVLSR